MPTVFVDGDVLTGPALTAALATATADAASNSAVQSVAGRTGVVALTVTDVAGAYPSTNPLSFVAAGTAVLTGTPTAPTASTGTSTTQIATTAFVAASVVAATTGVATFNTRSGAISLTSGDVTTALTFTPYSAANPAGYQTAAQVSTATPDPATVAPLIDGTAAVGTSLLYARQDHAHPTDTTRAPLVSPALTGAPTAPTAANSTANTQIATTAFVRTATTTNDGASTGQVGEFRANQAGSVSLTNTVSGNITSLVSLPAGDWDVYGNVQFVPAGSTTISVVGCAISTVSATMPATPIVALGALQLLNASFVTGAPQALVTGTARLSLATATTVFLVALADFGVSTMVANGYIGARRAR